MLETLKKTDKLVFTPEIGNPYFDLFRGRLRYLSEIQQNFSVAMPAVATLLADRKLFGQYTLPDSKFGISDMLIGTREGFNAREG